MIFITVGSTKFDELVRKIDELAHDGKIKNVLAQIGNGEYIPKNIKYFRFDKSLIKYCKSAELVISHEGAGTLFEIVSMNKKAIVITNPGTVDNPDLVKKLSSLGHLMWCKNLDEVELYIKRSKKFKPKKYKSPKCEIGKQIERYLS